MDVSYVDRQTKDIICLQCLLARQDLFDRTADAKRVKIKGSKEPVQSFFNFDFRRESAKTIFG